MKGWLTRFGLILALLLVAPDSRGADDVPRLFLSCPTDCFEDYLKQELSYFSFVRDRYLADANLIVSRQQAGNGGERFTVRALWSKDAIERMRIPVRPLEEAFLVPPAATIDEARAALAQATLRVLYRSLAESHQRYVFNMSVPPRSAVNLSELFDPWNYFVLVPELSVSGEGGSGYYFVEGTGALTIRRTTEPWRLRVRGSYTRNWNGFQLEDGSRVSADIPSWQFRALSAHAIGRRWALGGLLTLIGSDYENFRGHLRAAPAIEFNIFPYSENASQQLRFVYQAGVWWASYLEGNRQGLMEEVRPYHALSFVSDVNQAWGSIQWVLQGNQFVDAPSLFRLSTGTNLSLRLTSGLAFVLEAEFAWVEDLVNLRGRPVTDQELLLWTVQQPTSFTFVGKAGLAYTFGSHHNSIVNPRFGRIDLNED